MGSLNFDWEEENNPPPSASPQPPPPPAGERELPVNTPVGGGPVLLSVAPHAGGCFAIEPRQTTRIGRDPSRCDLVLTGASVNDVHCKIMPHEDGLAVLDLESPHGTFVNGQRLTTLHRLHVGDLIGIGPHVLLFASPPGLDPILEGFQFSQLQAVLSRLFRSNNAIQTLLREAGMLNPTFELRGPGHRVWGEILEMLRRGDAIASLDRLLACARLTFNSDPELVRLHAVIQSWSSERHRSSPRERVNLELELASDAVRAFTASQSLRAREGVEYARREAIRRGPQVPPEELPFDLLSKTGSFPMFPPPMPQAGSPRGGGLELGRSGAFLDGDDAGLGGLDEFSPPNPEMRRPPEASSGGPTLLSGKPVAGTPVAALTAAPAAAAPTAPAISETAAPVASPAEAAPPAVPAQPKVGLFQRLAGRLKKAKTSAPVADTAPAQASAQAPAPAAAQAPAKLPVKATNPAPAAAGVKTTASNRSIKVTAGGTPIAPPWEAGKTAPAASPAKKAAASGAGKRALGGVMALVGVLYVGMNLLNDDEEEESDSPTPVEATPAAADADAAAGKRSSRQGKGGDAAKKDAKDGKKAEAAPVKDVPVTPVFNLLNFLTDKEEAAYTAATLPAGAEWDADKNQVKSASVRNCQWVGGQERPFESREGKPFRYIRCATADSVVEGWVNAAAIQLKTP